MNRPESRPMVRVTKRSKDVCFLLFTQWCIACLRLIFCLILLVVYSVSSKRVSVVVGVQLFFLVLVIVVTLSVLVFFAGSCGIVALCWACLSWGCLDRFCVLHKLRRALPISVLFFLFSLQ